MVDFDQFKEVDVQILGVNGDDSFSQKTFADSLGLPFPILSDLGGKITQLYAADKFYKAGINFAPFMLPGLNIEKLSYGATWGRFVYCDNSCSKAFASSKSAVSNPSVNHSYTGASRSEASWRLSC